MQTLLNYYKTPYMNLIQKYDNLNIDQLNNMTAWQKQSYDLVMKHKNKEQNNGN